MLDIIRELTAVLSSIEFAVFFELFAAIFRFISFETFIRVIL